MKKLILKIVGSISSAICGFFTGFSIVNGFILWFWLVTGFYKGTIFNVIADTELFFFFVSLFMFFVLNTTLAIGMFVLANTCEKLILSNSASSTASKS